jgi:hypothetical protein
MNILGGIEKTSRWEMVLVWFGAKYRALSPRVQLKLPAEVAIRVWLHIFGQIFANAAPIAIGDAEPLQLRSRLSDALASPG